MVGKSQRFNTSLNVQELAAIFQEAAGSQIKGWKSGIAAVARMRGADTGFFTPTFDGPFAAVSNLPAFAVGVIIPKWGNGANGDGHAVHMYVWDEGNHREVELYAPHGLVGGGSAVQRLAKFLPFFTAKDPAAQVGAVN